MIHLPKSPIPPPCLEEEKNKKSGDYKCGDVLARLKADFKNKCYLCEDKGIRKIEIEHFIPHRGDKDLMFDWTNLFFACGHCNNTKLAKYDEILDCTKDNQVEVKIKYWMNPFPKEKVEITALEDTEIVNRTAELLDKIYNGITKTKITEADNLKEEILTEIMQFQEFLYKFYGDTYSAEDKEDFKKHIIRHLSSSSKFTAFKRWIIRNNSNLMQDFQDYLG